MQRLRLLRASRRNDGYTLVELIAVMAILLTVLTALTSLFVSGAKAELDMNRRFQAQQEARIAADRMRREVHCASGVTVTSAASVTVTLPAHCPTAVGGVITNVVYDTVFVSTKRYKLRRAGTTIADYLTSGDVFSYVTPSADSLGRLHLNVPVNVNPNEGWKTWRLETDIVLRNTQRQNP
jgi:prepilin-type N-terminal cleavage/methylation domain-containing protein